MIRHLQRRGEVKCFCLVSMPTFRPESYLLDSRALHAIKEDLSEKQKLLSLAHELGHYVHHYSYLLFFAQLFLLIQNNTMIEFSISKELTESWWELYYKTTECQADIFASYFVIPYRSDESLEVIKKKIVSHYPWSTDAQRISLIRNFFETEYQAVGFAQVEQWINEAAEEQFNILRQPYIPDKSLFERMVWCTFQRRNPSFKAMIGKELQILGENLEKVSEKLLKMSRNLDKRMLHSQTIPSLGQRQIIKRSTIQNLADEFLSSKEHWAPIIIEPMEVSEIRGYLGLIPSLFTRANGSSMDWTRCEAPVTAPVGRLEDWIEFAKSKQKGVMLFPLSPLDMYLRRHLYV